MVTTTELGLLIRLYKLRWYKISALFSRAVERDLTSVRLKITRNSQQCTWHTVTSYEVGIRCSSQLVLAQRIANCWTMNL